MFSNELWNKSGVPATYSIDQSIRFNSADTAYMHRTPSSTGNRKTFTSSFWVKLGKLGVNTQLPMPGVTHGIGSSGLSLTTANVLNAYIYYGGSWSGLLIGTRVFRDPSAWFHFVIVVDTTNSIASERIRIYINGQRETNFSSEAYPTQNTDTDWNLSGEKMWIGIDPSGSGYNGEYYASEMVYIDGTAYGPENFGETNDSGIWVPKDVSGLTFGTNGFHIDGRDSADLGDDESGNGNDFTASGLAAHDQVADSPTNNFATINSIYADNAPAGNAGTLSNGNLQYAGSGSSFCIKGLTFNLPKSGKWYFEYMIGGNNDGFGFIKQGEQGSINASNGPGNVSVAQGGGIQYQGWRNGGNFTTNFADTNTGSPFTAGFIHQVAIDVDNGKFYYGVKNTYYAADAGSDGNPSAGTNELSTFAFSTTDVVLLAGNYSGTQYWNFGQDGTFAGQQTAQGNSDANGVGNFYYAVPTGYLALCSKNVGS